MFARLLLIPFGLGALMMLYLTWEVHEGYAPYIIPFVLVMAVIYVFAPQINWWWYNRNPPELDASLRQLFLEKMPFYQALNQGEQERFRQRMALYIMGNEFMPQSMESVPEDIKGIIALNATRMTFGLPDILMEKFEKFIICPSWFPSPQYPEDFHTSEIFEEDGVILYSGEHLIHSFMQAAISFNFCLYELIKAFCVEYDDQGYPEVSWDQLEKLEVRNRTEIKDYINLALEDIDPLGVAGVFFFEQPVKFQKHLPEVFKHFRQIFNQNPLEQNDPVITKSVLVKEK